MLKWKIAGEGYLKFLRENYDSRIPYSDYGRDKYKPFFGELFELGEISYISQITSPKERHFRLKNSMDFYKIYDPQYSTRLIGVINLNYMFPVKTSALSDLEYHDIGRYRTFKDLTEKSQYIDLLKKEMKQMQKLDLGEKAQRLYTHKAERPKSPVSRRCFDFRLLESACRRYYGING